MNVREVVQLGAELLPRKYAIELDRYMARANRDEVIDQRGMRAIATHMIGEYGSEEGLEPSLKTLEELTDTLEPYRDAVPEEVAEAVLWVLENLSGSFGQRDALQDLLGPGARLVEVVVPKRSVLGLISSLIGLSMTDIPDEDEEEDPEEVERDRMRQEMISGLGQVLHRIIESRQQRERPYAGIEALERVLRQRAEEGDNCAKCSDRHGCVEIGLAQKCPTCGAIHKAGLPCINPECGV